MKQVRKRKQISYINPYIRDLEKWCWWIYLQGSDGDADTENKLVVTAGAGESGADWESSIEAYTLLSVKLDSLWEFAVWCKELKWGAPWQLREVEWDGSWEGGLRGTEHMYEVKWSEVKSLSHVRLFVTPWTVAYQDPQSMGFSRQEYWSGLPFPSAGDLPDPGIKPESPAL